MATALAAAVEAVVERAGVLAGTPAVAVVVVGAVAAAEAISAVVVFPGAAEARNRGCNKSNIRSRAVARDAAAAVAKAEP